MLKRSSKKYATKVRLSKKKRTICIDEFYSDTQNNMLCNNDDIDTDLNYTVGSTFVTMP